MPRTCARPTRWCARRWSAACSTSRRSSRPTPTSSPRSRKACRSPTRARPSAPPPRRSCKKMEAELKATLASAKARGTASGPQHRQRGLRAVRHGGMAHRTDLGSCWRGQPCWRAVTWPAPSARRAPAPVAAARPRRRSPRPTPAPAPQLADYYARVQTGLLAPGAAAHRWRRTDVPFGQRDLVRNFLKIAFYEEYADTGGTLVARESRQPDAPLGGAGDALGRSSAPRCRRRARGQRRRRGGALRRPRWRASPATRCARCGVGRAISGCSSSTRTSAARSAPVLRADHARHLDHRGRTPW